MEETTSSKGLYERMCHMFPDVPKNIVQHYVTQHINDEESCAEHLRSQHRILKAQYTDMNGQVFMSQLENLDINEDSEIMDGVDVVDGGFRNSTPSYSRNTGNRSISDAGLARNSSVRNISPSAQSQTAPASSENFHGFNYAVYYSYANSYTHSNNNIMFSPVVTTNMENSILLHPPENYPRSVSPHSDSPSGVGCSQNNVARTGVCTSNESIAGTSVQPALPPRPAGYRSGLLHPIPTSGSYILVPQMPPSSAVPTQGSSALRSSPSLQRFQSNPITEVPEEEAGTHAQRNDRRTSSDATPVSTGTNFDSQLHVNIETNDVSPHDWRPFQSYPTPNQQIPYHMSQGFQNANFSISPIYQTDHMRVEQVPTSLRLSPVYYHSSIPVVPFPTLQYAHQPYFAVTSSSQIVFQESDTQKYIEQQKQNLNILRYELGTNKIEIANCKEEFATVEQKRKDQYVLPNKDEMSTLNEENEKLRRECYLLCMEVDQHLKGKARLGEINDDFYTCINTGQQGPLHVAATPGSSSQPEPSTSHSHSKSPPKRPKRPPRRHPQQQISSSEAEENEESSKWTCPKCTFQNHPAISVCEMCQVGENVACSS